MPQSSYVYAVARIRAVEKGLIGRDKMHRMAEGTLEEAMRMLSEAGYGEMPDATPADCEAMIVRERDKAARLVQEVSPLPAVTDLFLLQADVHNLKVLIKARLLNSGEKPVLMGGGLYEPEALKSMVADQDYRNLPPAFASALNGLEKELLGKESPQKVSVALDRANLLHAADVLGKEKSAKLDFARSYFAAMADFNNVLALLRLRDMGAPKEALTDVLLPGGDLMASTLTAAFEQPFDAMAKTVARCGAGLAIQAGLDEVQRTGQNGALEKARDNHLIELVRKGKYGMEDLRPILGYLIAREQEAKCIRLIVTAKRNGLPEAVITERLRELYG